MHANKSDAPTWPGCDVLLHLHLPAPVALPCGAHTHTPLVAPLHLSAPLPSAPCPSLSPSVFPLFHRPEDIDRMVESMADFVRTKYGSVDCIVGLDSRGFLIGPLVWCTSFVPNVGFAGALCMCLCMYACMHVYVCMCVCMYVYGVHACTCVWLHVSRVVPMYVRGCGCGSLWRALSGALAPPRVLRALHSPSLPPSPY